MIVTLMLRKFCIGGSKKTKINAARQFLSCAIFQLRSNPVLFQSRGHSPREHLTLLSWYELYYDEGKICEI